MNAIRKGAGPGSSGRHRFARLALAAVVPLVTVATVLAAPVVPAEATCHPAGPQAYVANGSGNSVSVINNCNQVIATVGVGDDPVALAVNPAGTRLYVANFGGNSVSVIDTSDDMVVATIPVGSEPSGIAVNPAGTRVYVTNLMDGTVSVIDTSLNFVLVTVPVGSLPIGVTFGRNGTRAYVAISNGGLVSVMDAATSSVADTALVGGNPSSVAASPDGSAVYVDDVGLLVVVDAAIDQDVNELNINTGVTSPASLAISPDGGTLYAVDFPGRQLLAISTVTDAVSATIPLDGNPTSVAVTPDGVFGYVVKQGVSTVNEFNTNSESVVGTIGVGSGPTDVATVPMGPRVHGFDGVSCVTRSYCVAVGTQETPTGIAAFAEVLSGGRWRLTGPVSVPGALATGLDNVSCRSTTDCVAVGTAVTRPAAGGPVRTVPLGAVWNGSRWTSSLPPVPTAGRGGELRDVSCTGGSGCVAVGSYPTSAGLAMPLSERWTGRSWQLLTTPGERGARIGRLGGVSCGGTHCAAVGAFRSSSGWDLVALFATLSNWLLQRMQAIPGRPAYAAVQGVSCAAPQSCLAVGYAATSGHAAPFTERLARGRWTLLARAAGTPANSVLDAISCTALNHCVATGSTTAHGKDSPLAEIWNGATWRVLKVPGPVSSTLSVLDQVSCTGAGFCLAVGKDGTRMLAELWNGRSWRVLATPSI